MSKKECNLIKLNKEKSTQSCCRFGALNCDSEKIIGLVSQEKIETQTKNTKLLSLVYYLKLFLSFPSNNISGTKAFFLLHWTSMILDSLQHRKCHILHVNK